ncbi:MAG: PQQ-dependent sugar dehydrogenase [Pirellulaceae bacterium]
MSVMIFRLAIALNVTLFPLIAAVAQRREVPFTALRLEPIAEGLTAPHYLVTPPNDARRFVVDLVGQIRLLQEDGKLRNEPFLDVSERMVKLQEGYDERGLLGLAFHPDFKQNGRFFVYYSAPLRDEGPDGWNNTSHLSEFRVSEQADRADPASERILMRIDQPQLNHNGGRLLFGPDGYLYVGLGDGGAAADRGEGHPPLGNGQDVSTLLGSILRIDVEEEPFGIPEDNPLVGFDLPDNADYLNTQPRGEIWAWGIRNTWGMSFDRKTGELYAADVGQILWEEVNLMKRPGNYGWHRKEGTHGFDPQNMDKIIDDAPKKGLMGEPLIDPIIEYTNAQGHDDGLGVCVVGGHVYRGSSIPELAGQYVFGDWSGSETATGLILVAAPSGQDHASRDGLWPIKTAIKHHQYILGFGEDNDGELYVLTSSQRGPSGTTGRVFRIVREP